WMAPTRDSRLSMRSPKAASSTAITCCMLRAPTCFAVWEPGPKRRRATRERSSWSAMIASGGFWSGACVKFVRRTGDPRAAVGSGMRQTLTTGRREHDFALQRNEPWIAGLQVFAQHSADLSDLLVRLGTGPGLPQQAEQERPEEKRVEVEWICAGAVAKEPDRLRTERVIGRLGHRLVTIGPGLAAHGVAEAERARRDNGRVG